MVVEVDHSAAFNPDPRKQATGETADQMRARRKEEKLAVKQANRERSQQQPQPKVEEADAEDSTPTPSEGEAADGDDVEDRWEDVGVVEAAARAAREAAEDSAKDIKVATVGNVDSGKSTLVGVLTRGQLDDGRGKARSKVFNFSHEAANGRTSSVAQEIMGFSEGGEQVLVDRHGQQGVTQSAAARNAAWQQIVGRSSKLLTFIDLCGHEKYLKTTIFGLVGLCPDHAMIVVNANAGFQKMSREHLGIALALKIPISVVVTKVDIAPANVYEENVSFLCKMMKSKAVAREPVVVKHEGEIPAVAAGCVADKVCPIFCVSNVTGEGLDLLKCFLQQISPRRSETIFRPISAPAEFAIDGVFNVPGVGIVVAGLMKGGCVRPGQKMLLGPDANSWRPMLIRTIHYKRTPSECVESGQAASFSIKSLDKKYQLKKTSFRKGMVMVDAALNPQTTWEFKAEVVILHHATTIRVGYQAMVHCGIIRQAARVQEMSSDLLRTGDKATVTFRFCFHGEYLISGGTLLFREGRTKGLGKIIEVIDEAGIAQ